MYACVALTVDFTICLSSSKISYSSSQAAEGTIFLFLAILKGGRFLLILWNEIQGKKAKRKREGKQQKNEKLIFVRCIDDSYRI